MSLVAQKTIAEIVEEMEKNDKEGETQLSKYVSVSMREDIDRTEAYLHSKHISGDKDHLGREKPFFNIVISARNIWYRATDLDRKNIIVRPTKDADVTKSFLATLKLQEWMKKAGFGQFLNDWGLSLANHGSSVVKFVEKNGELHCSVVDWNNLLCDAVDFTNNVKIEKLWMTPAQLLKQKHFNQELVQRLIDNPQTRTTMDGQKKDNKDDYILVYELHGELPLSYITDEEKDEDTYIQQMHILTFQEQTNSSQSEENTYTLYRGREKKDPYMITNLIKKDGQTYVGGAVKNLFEAQWMVNHSQKQMKDQLDLASKIVFQTADPGFVGKNILTNIENGQILKHENGKPITQLNNRPDIGAMQAFQGAWMQVANQINNISESLQGQTAPSGTAWRQVEALLQESHSLFELMVENKGLALVDMMTEYVVPYLKKQLNNSEEISMILEDHQIKTIDQKYLPNEVNRRVNEKKKETILSGEIYDPGQEAMDEAAMMNQLQQTLVGNQRFIKPSQIESETWADAFKDLEWDLDYDVTGEYKDVRSMMATLSTVLQLVVGNPQALQDPNVKLLFNKILSFSGGVSPLELSQTGNVPQPQPVASVGGQTPQFEEVTQ